MAFDPAPLSSPDLFQQAIRSQKSGDLPAAEQAFRDLLATQPDHADAAHFLGLILVTTGRLEEAEQWIAHAVALRPNDPGFWCNLGEVACRRRDFQRGIAHLARAVELRPDFPEAHFNLGNARKGAGDFPGAIESYRLALRYRPTHAGAHFNLANTLFESGDVPAAVTSYRAALAIEPMSPEIHRGLGNALAEQGDVDSAIVVYEKACALAAATRRELDLEAQLANLHASQGNLDQARVWHGREIGRHPQRWLRQMRMEMLSEPIAPDGQYIDDYRTRVMETLARWVKIAPPAPAREQGGPGVVQQSDDELAEFAASGAEPSMALAYHARDEKPIMERYAELFAPRLTPGPLRRRDGVPHVGIVVTQGHEGVFFKSLGGIIDRLPGPDLRVTIICSNRGAGTLRQWLSNPQLSYLILPRGLGRALQVIRAAGFDLIHYWEVGTDPTNYFLPYLRPAAIQSTTWGWPVTSGNPHIDYFVSCDALEPPDAENCYTEKLVRLAALPTFHRPLPIPEPLRNRADFGLPATDHLYFCAQNLRKLHPDFDWVLAEILRTDPRGRVLLIADPRRPIVDKLLTRFKKTMLDVVDRIQFLPRLHDPQYLNVVKLADVALDTIGYGGGANTVYDAVGCGTPMVTLPGRFHRGRWCDAVYQRLGIDAGRATSKEDYVIRAVRLATDSDYRRDTSEQLLSRGRELFDDMQAVHDLRRFFLEAIDAGRRDDGNSTA